MDVAAELLIRAQQRDATNVRILALRSHCLLLLGEHNLAQDVALAAIWAVPEALEGYLALAYSYHALGLLEDAAAALSIASSRAALGRLRDPGGGFGDLLAAEELVVAGLHARCVARSGISYVPGRLSYGAGRTCACPDCVAVRLQAGHRLTLTASGEIRVPTDAEREVIAAVEAVDVKDFTRALVSGG